MSKQPSIMSYFKKQGSALATPTNEGKKPKQAEKRPFDERDENDVMNTPTSLKRKRVIIESSDEENNADAVPFSPMSNASGSRPSTPRFQSSMALSGSSTPQSVRRNKPSRSFAQSFNGNESDATSDSFMSNASSRVTTPSRSSKKKSAVPKSDEDNIMVHLTFDHLKPNKIKDGNGRPTSHPDYDPRTLFVPVSFYNSQTHGHRQWWDFKSSNFDAVLFFKVGKFYELYHMDAVIGVEHLGLVMMKGKYAHAGLPESSYGHYSDMLLRKGYKVCRIEQTETPAQLAERKTKEKVVRREIANLSTLATRTYSSFEAASNDKSSSAIDTGESSVNYLMAICEKVGDGGPTLTRFGVSFVDCTTGQFWLCDFSDEGSYSKLRTLLAHNQPTQLLIPRHKISKNTLAVINSVLGPVQKEELQTKTEFVEAASTLKTLLDEDYLGSSVHQWPQTLADLVADKDEPIPKSKPEFELGLSALGGVLWYLKKCLIDVDLVTMRKFDIYKPATILHDMEGLPSASRWSNRNMILDGFVLNSLNLLPPTDALNRSRTDIASLDKEGAKFSLLNTIDFCVTPFGRRLLRQWVCAPTCDANALLERQAAITFLCDLENKPLLEKANECLKNVGDLERLFQRIHTLGSKHRSEKHPDGRAQFFDLPKYNSRKVKDLCVTLDGVEKIQSLLDFFEQTYPEAEESADDNVGVKKFPQLLSRCLGKKSIDMIEDIDHFKALIPNRTKTIKEGQIKPTKGMDAEYDQSLLGVEVAEGELDDYLGGQRSKFNASSIKYVGTGKNRFTLEFPDALADTLGDEYELKSKRKGFKRFRTPALEKLIQRLCDAEKVRDTIVQDSTRRVFFDFDQRKEKWLSIVGRIALFDCIQSLANYNMKSPVTMCLPSFDFESKKPYLEIRDGNHPMLVMGQGKLYQANAYVSNDTILHDAPVLLLTGPNMGGKSTLSRQTALLAVLAQLGSYVPATSLKMSPVDRVFTRIGAYDCLIGGISTFYMELSEVNVILKEASLHSLAIIDELGRGTSTFDGMAIASATLKNLVEKVQCRTLFSTHYHSLCKKFGDDSRVQLGHMACMVENEDEASGDPSLEDLVFLYKLSPGSAPKSYGFYTARVAGISDTIVRRAFQCSKLINDVSKEPCVEKVRRLIRDVKLMSNDELIQAVHSN